MQSKMWVFTTVIICLMPHIMYGQAKQLMHDGQIRTYVVYQPSLDPNSNGYPLVIGLHGTGVDGVTFIGTAGLIPKANKEKFIVACPDALSHGTYTYFNAGGEFETLTDGTDDLGFISALIDTMIANYNIDTTRIYVMGFSNGSAMSYRVAAELSRKVAAIGAVSGQMVYEYCDPEFSVPIMHFHGLSDRLIPFEGNDKSIPSVDSAMDIWREKNDCYSFPYTVFYKPGIIGKEWTSWDGNGDVVLYTIQDQEHEWPRLNTLGISATDVIWDFFELHLRSRVTISNDVASEGSISRCQESEPNDPNAFLESEVDEATVICMYGLTDQEGEPNEVIITPEIMERFLREKIGLGDDAIFPSRTWLNIDSKNFIPYGSGREDLIAAGITPETPMTAANYLRFVDIVFGDSNGRTTLGEIQLQLYTNQDNIPNTRNIGAEDVKDDNHWIHHREWWANERTFDYIATLAGLPYSPLRDQTLTDTQIGFLIGGNEPSMALEVTLMSWGVSEEVAYLAGHLYGDNRTACDSCEYNREEITLDCFCSVLDLLTELDGDEIFPLIKDIPLPMGSVSGEGPPQCTPVQTLCDADARRLVDVTTSYPDEPDGVVTKMEFMEFMDAVINFIPNGLPGLDCASSDMSEVCVSVQAACDYCPLMPIDDLCAIVDAGHEAPEFQVQGTIIPYIDGDWLD